MRIPKYKAYLKDYKMIVDVESINFAVKTVYVKICKGDPYEFNFDEIELMEHTGLSDINDKDLYGGDKVKCWNGNISFICHDGFQFCIGKNKRPLKQHELRTFEKIGTIHEDQK